MSDSSEPVEVHLCETLVELALIRALFDHRQIVFSVDEDEKGYHVCVLPHDVDRARVALGDRGFGEEQDGDDDEEVELGLWEDEASGPGVGADAPQTELPGEAFQSVSPRPVPSGAAAQSDSPQGILERVRRALFRRDRGER